MRKKNSLSQSDRPRKKVFRRVFLVMLYLFSITIGSLFGFFLSYLNRLPQIENVENFMPHIPSQVFASDNEKIREFYVEKRVLLHSMEELSPDLRNGIVAVEDAHFFQHPGVDPWGILRALYVNLRSGRTVEGGSTLTQQLAKILFLKPERTLERKIQEAMLAVQLERRYTKEEVFLLYCNQVYLGGVYGVQAASNYYFGKSAKELNLEEAALIAALPKAPQKFSPYTHYDRAIRRRNHVLERMILEDFITREEGEKAKKKPVRVKKITPETSISPYFEEEIRKYLEAKYGFAGIYENGMQIYSTLDVDMQRVANTALNRGIRRLDQKHGFRKITTKMDLEEIDTYVAPEWSGNLEPDMIVKGVVREVSEGSAIVQIDGQHVPLLPSGWKWTRKRNATSILSPGDVTDFRITEMEGDEITAITLDQPPLVEGALVAMDVRTGKVRAMVGGSDFLTKKFNRATQAYRQTGSAFKPFVYAAAFARGHTPSDVMIDSPISYYDKWTEETWAPKNYTNDFLGPMTLRRALELSRNTVAVKLLEEIGINYTMDYVRRFDIGEKMQPYLPLALGASEATLIDMVRAYGAFANQGLMMKDLYVERILDRNGNLLEENLPQAKEVMRADIAYIMTDVLQGVVKRGTAVKARTLEMPIAGKTGTTDDCTDAWFLGYTPSIAVGVWVGFDEKKTLGRKETGSEAALPIWIEFFKTVLKDEPVEEFQATGNIVSIPIDRLTGLRATPYCTNVITESFVAGSEPTQYCGPEHHGVTTPTLNEEVRTIERSAHDTAIESETKDTVIEGNDRVAGDDEGPS